jgi:hypothetical protein
MESLQVAFTVVAAVVVSVILGIIVYAVHQGYAVKSSIEIPFVKGAIELQPGNKK